MLLNSACKLFQLEPNFNLFILTTKMISRSKKKISENLGKKVCKLLSFKNFSVQETQKF
jgi:hypothetical protein